MTSPDEGEKGEGDGSEGGEIDGPIEPPDLDPTAFSDPTNIDHMWFPLVPGTQLVYKGITIEDDDEEIPHLVMFTVTDLTKVIGGITAVIIWGEDFAEVELVETAIAFFCSGR